MTIQKRHIKHGTEGDPGLQLSEPVAIDGSLINAPVCKHGFVAFTCSLLHLRLRPKVPSFFD